MAKKRKQKKGQSETDKGNVTARERKPSSQDAGVAVAVETHTSWPARNPYSRREPEPEPVPDPASGLAEVATKSDPLPEGRREAAEDSEPGVLATGLRGLVTRWLQRPAKAKAPKGDPSERLLSISPNSFSARLAPPAAPPGIVGEDEMSIHEAEASAQVLAELAEAKQLLRQERETSQQRIQQLEGQLSQSRAEAEQERAQRRAAEQQLLDVRDAAAREAAEYESRLRLKDEAAASSAAPLAELRAEMEKHCAHVEQLESLLERSKGELEAAQGRLRKEREASLGRIHQLETELQQARNHSTELEARLKASAESTGRKKGRAVSESEDESVMTSRAAGRLESLENELNTTNASMSEDQLTATGRISRLESRWEDLKSRLLPKDREIGELRRQADKFRGQIQELEAALGEARQQAAGPSEEAPPGKSKEGEKGLSTLSREAVQTLYNQSMTRLTVLMASADIVLMNPKLDPKVISSVKDIKAEGQALLELIKSYTLPTETQKTTQS